MRRWAALTFIVLALSLSCTGWGYVATTTALDRLCASSAGGSLKVCWQYEFMKEFNR